MKIIKFQIKNWASGQLMLLSVMILASILSIALFLTVSFVTNMREARMVMDSVRAFYAADAGVELSLFRYFKGEGAPDVVMTNNTSCCMLDVKTPASTGSDLQITSTGYSPFATSSDRITRSIETQGF